MGVKGGSQGVMNKFLPLFSENVQKEGQRLSEQVANLVPYAVPETNLTVEFVGIPSMVDGKVKCLWALNTNMSICYLCLSGATKNNYFLGCRHSPHHRVKNRDALKYGFSPLHVRLRSFDWFLKTRTYRDVRYHEAR